MRRQQQAKGREENPPKKSGKLSKNEAKRREEKLKMNLHLAEIGQVEEYIKNRSMEVDREIEETRKRMNLSMSMSNELSKAAKQFTAKSDLRVSGQKHKEGLRKEKSSPVRHDSRGSREESSAERERKKQPTREFEWRDLRERLVASLRESRMTPFQVTETFLPSELAREKEIFLLLEEVVDVFQIDFVHPISENDKALLLHFYGDNHATSVNIKELLTDLTYWDTNRKSLHTAQESRSSNRFDRDDDLDAGLPAQFKNNTYGGHSSTNVLSNTDTFVEDSARRNPHHRLMSATNPVAVRGGSLHPITEKPSENLDETSEIIENEDENEHTNAALNRSALADIHALVHSSTGTADFLPKSTLLNFDDYKEDKFDDVDDKEKSGGHQDEEDEDEKLLAQLRSHAEQEKLQINSSRLEDKSTSKPKTISEAQKENKSSPLIINNAKDKSNATTTEKETEKSIREIAAENVAAQLALENERLKHELSAFDSEFFEELEDLKFKYAKLQVCLAYTSCSKNANHFRCKTIQYVDWYALLFFCTSRTLLTKTLLFGPKRGLINMRPHGYPPLDPSPSICHRQTHVLRGLWTG